MKNKKISKNLLLCAKNSKHGCATLWALSFHCSASNAALSFHSDFLAIGHLPFCFTLNTICFYCCCCHILKHLIIFKTPPFKSEFKLIILILIKKLSIKCEENKLISPMSCFTQSIHNPLFQHLSFIRK